MLESATARELKQLFSPLLADLVHTSEALHADAKYTGESAQAVIKEEADRRRRIIESFLKSFTERLVFEAKIRLLAAGGVWENCDMEWGAGIKKPRYTDRVAGHFDRWGVDHSPTLLDALSDLVEQAATDDTGMLRSLLEG